MHGWGPRIEHTPPCRFWGDGGSESGAADAYRLGLIHIEPYDVDSGQEIPQTMRQDEIDFFKERPILHFKGPRKHLMRIMAQATGLL